MSPLNKDNARDDRSTSGREKILHEATHLFAVYGYEGTSLRMIADAVGMQKGSLVYHFASKENIREAVLDSLLLRWKDVLPALMLTAATGENRFERTITECIQFFAQDHNRARLLLREAMDNPDEMRARLADQLAPWLGVIVERIQQGQQEHLIPNDVDPIAFVWLVVMMALGSFAMADFASNLFGTRQHTADEVTQRLTDELVRMARTALFLHGSGEGLAAATQQSTTNNHPKR